MTITLTSDQAAYYVEFLVSSGKYASASEVVHAGIHALEEHNHFVRRWLKTDVAPVYDLMVADPSPGIPIDDVIEQLRAQAKIRTLRSKLQWDGGSCA
jgi:antitoxin ParD1/3/4